MNKQTMARLTIGFAISFVLILAALHFLEPQFNLGGHLISEYELGPYGWLMSVAFFGLAGASLLLYFFLKDGLQTLAGRIGRWWLLLIVLAYLGAGAFYPDDSTGGLGLPLDPADCNRGTIAPTLNATLHGLSGIIVILSSPIVFTLLQRSLAQNEQWVANMTGVRKATALTWLGLLSFPVSLILYNLLQQPGGFDFRIIVSVANRFMILTYAFWMVTTASQKQN
jgi:Protein of unknown function (DUF998)